jgi:hypothetical protein
MHLISIRNSDAVDVMTACPLRGVVNVCFTNGYSYEYSNVSRRAIINLMANPNMSLGFWINDNCVNSERAIARHRYHYATV